ncbi:MAG TPA: L,D-transpeptidase [Solirubrobacteraceae bacterium]|nr:L,D-transpeptidase [Solirubrobacteraceae bacterium]
MASEPLLAGAAAPGLALRRAAPWVGAVLLVLLLAAVAAALTLSGASLAGDSTALAKVSVQPLGGTIEHVEAFGPTGRRVPMSIQGGLLTPTHHLHPGERISVAVRVKRPGWLGWALGSVQTEHLTVTAPVARLKERWLTVAQGRPVTVAFQQPVSAVSYESSGATRTHRLGEPASRVSLGARGATGTVQIAAAARSWETVGKPTHVSWFPPSRSPVLAASPATGAKIAPASPIYLTFSKPVDQVLGSARPKLSPATQGHWMKANSHTLEFRPTGFGLPLGSTLHATLPRAVAVTAEGSRRLSTTKELSWVVPPGSTVRLHELLAQAGYLPVSWRPSGAEVARTPSAEAAAAVKAPAGTFGWRYGNTPHQLREKWSPSEETVLTKGAIMKLENENGMPIDGVAGPTVWRKLFANAIVGKRLTEGYSYVYVHREVPETATLWSAGHTIIVAPANTGISGAETALGSYPVFEHIPEGTMSGTNPDGSHYEDPGIKWISYFNGGDALHNFDRASFGTPQSLGCVELPLAASAKIWKYTPIGTVVTIEG